MPIAETTASHSSLGSSGWRALRRFRFHFLIPHCCRLMSRVKYLLSWLASMGSFTAGEDLSSHRRTRSKYHIIHLTDCIYFIFMQSLLEVLRIMVTCGGWTFQDPWLVGPPPLFAPPSHFLTRTITDPALADHTPVAFASPIHRCPSLLLCVHQAHTLGTYRALIPRPIG